MVDLDVGDLVIRVETELSIVGDVVRVTVLVELRRAYFLGKFQDVHRQRNETVIAD